MLVRQLISRALAGSSGASFDASGVAHDLRLWQAGPMLNRPKGVGGVDRLEISDIQRRASRRTTASRGGDWRGTGASPPVQPFPSDSPLCEPRPIATVAIGLPRSVLSTGLRRVARRKSAPLREISRGGGRDSNPRPPGPQPGALPTELPPPWTGQDTPARAGVSRRGSPASASSGRLAGLRRRRGRSRRRSCASRRAEGKRGR